MISENNLYESSFDRAIKDKNFVVWVQPKYNTFSGRITSAEALVRWEWADGRLLRPGTFIPVFEADGLIVQLDKYVFRDVCQKQKALLDSGKNPVPISVNLSRATLLFPDTIKIYKRIIEETDVPIELVPIELTESATIENAEINELVHELKEAGFSLHLDDFGSGYSSMASLNALKMDVLKLDKSLIDGIGNKGGDEIIRHTIEIAHFFQMEVVAEGVENEDQYNFLKKLSCDTIQGYLFSQPVTFDEFINMYESQPKEKSEMIDGEALSEEASVGSLRITNDTKLQYLSALTRIYMTMHVIDLKEDTVVEFATTTNVKEHCNKVHDCVNQMKETMAATVAPEYVDAVLKFTDLTTIAKRMKGKKTISEEFVGKHFGWFSARFITITVNGNDEPEKLIYTTQVLEADKRKENSVDVCRTDELTGVFNLAAFEDDKKYISLRPDLTILVADVNGLHDLNAQFGYTAGDDVIWGTADILNRTVGKDGRIYRLESDQFVTLFYSDEKHTAEIIEDLNNAVHNWMGNEIRNLSISYGVVTAAEFPEKDLDQLIEEANTRRLEYKKQIKKVTMPFVR